MEMPLESPRSDAPGASWTCPSCGSANTARYCGNCGECRLADAAELAGRKNAIARKRSFAVRMYASLRSLASPPGRLTADWIRGRRVGYLAPLSLFLWVNVAFFLVQSATHLGILTWPLRIHLLDDSIGWLTNRMLRQHVPGMAVPTAAYAGIFDALESVHAKSLVIVMVPPFAAALHVLMLGRRKRFRDAMTFAMHFFAFALIWLCALFPLVALTLRLLVITGLPMPSDDSLDLAVTGLEVAVLAWYLAVALSTVFGMSRLRRLATTIALIAALYYILRAYHVVVFAVTLYSI